MLLYVEIIIEKIELMITTNKIPKSLKPINRIEKGTHAILGNDRRPAENEFSVFPNPLNFTIASPIVVPRATEMRNAVTSLAKVTPILTGREWFQIILTKDSATM